MSTINRTAHGLTADQRVVFSSIVPSGTGLDPDIVYWVLPDGLTADVFQVSETQDGTPLVLSANVASAQMQVVPETPDSDTFGTGYTDITDPADVMAPPTIPPVPTAPTVDSAIVSGIVRLRVTLNNTAEAKARMWEVDLTHKYDTFGAADWTTPQILPMAENSTEMSIPAYGSTLYTARVRMQDVYGNFSGYSTEVNHTTIAGSDSMSAAQAALATDVPDGIITETKIANDSITTPKLRAGAVTADILASTILLASLIKTADTGRRIEIDIDGIRLYDVDGSLLVRIPTNGDPVFVRGQLTADSLVSQTTATFRTAISFEGNSVTTLQGGVSNPTTPPTVGASLDYGTLATGASTGSLTGIGYDSGGGSFWVATDPSSGYVASEYSASTGALLRRIAATGSTATSTATVGSTSHISDTAQSKTGTTDTHIATPLVIPGGLTNVHITKVSIYAAGVGSSVDLRNGIWSTGGSLLGESATYTVGSVSFSAGSSVRNDKDMTSPIAVASGATVWAGMRRMSTSDTVQWDRDDGSGKTTLSSDGLTGSGTGWGTLNASSKPDVYITYTYDVDTRLETAKMIGVCTDGSYVYTLDANGVVWKYNRVTLAHVAHSTPSLTGVKASYGLFYDATAARLVIVHHTGTSTSEHVKFAMVDPATLAVGTILTDSGMSPINANSNAFRGGARLADPLNGNAATYWVPIASGSVWAFLASTGQYVANRDFSNSTYSPNGLTHDGTQFIGWDGGSRVYRFTDWDFTTTSPTLWVGYSWYDSNATGGTHETAVGPRTSIAVRRRERVQVQTPTIPTGGVDDPDRVRVYFLQNATDTGPSTYWLQSTDALTSRLITSYTASGTHDGAGTAFAAGTPAQLKSVAQPGWLLKGDGTKTGFLRYVPITPFAAKNASTTATIANGHTGDVGTIPTDAVAVSLRLSARHSVTTNGGRLQVFGYGTAIILCEIFPGTVANQYTSGNVLWVPLGGTNNREFDWGVTLGAAGTINYEIWVLGYWTYN